MIRNEHVIFVSCYLAAPNIEFGPEYFEGLTVKAGDNIRLKVTITGRPVPKVVWYRDGVEITKKIMDIINMAGSSTLFARDTDRTHKGLYTVEATNGSGTKKENINVQVQGAVLVLYTELNGCVLPECVEIYMK